MARTIELDQTTPTPLRDALMQESAWLANLDECMVCAKCLSVCPLAGYEGFDPRRLVRLTLLGQEQEVIDFDGIFQCTGCDRCTWVCPMGVKIGNLITRARGLRPRDKQPGKAQLTCELHRDKGNNMQIATQDWLETVDWMREELAAGSPI